MASTARIIVSNDDGIHAPGVHALAAAAQNFGEVTVVAPEGAQSGMGHAISIGKPLRLFEETLPNGIKGYACNGTPADCVKMATGVVMKDKVDLVVSGINHGSNSSISAIYSGTMSAAREGTMQGIAGIGFSLLNFDHSADMSSAGKVAEIVIRQALEQPLAPGQLLNVNIPDLPFEEIKGFKITRQSKGRWVEEFEERLDPFGRKYYWLGGRFELRDDREDTDEYALRNGYVSITPMMNDLTDYALLKTMANWNI